MCRSSRAHTFPKICAPCPTPKQKTPQNQGAQRIPRSCAPCPIWRTLHPFAHLAPAPTAPGKRAAATAASASSIGRVRRIRCNNAASSGSSQRAGRLLAFVDVFEQRLARVCGALHKHRAPELPCHSVNGPKPALTLPDTCTPPARRRRTSAGSSPRSASAAPACTRPRCPAASPASNLRGRIAQTPALPRPCHPR